MKYIFLIALFFLNCSWLIYKEPKQDEQSAHELQSSYLDYKIPEPLVLPLPQDTSAVPDSEVDEAPRAISQLPPSGHPPNLKQFEGTVYIKMLIGRDGSVIYAYVLKTSGNVLVDNEGLRTAMRWQFTPAKRKGEPVQVWLGVPIRFKTEK